MRVKVESKFLVDWKCHYRLIFELTEGRYVENTEEGGYDEAENDTCKCSLRFERLDEQCTCKHEQQCKYRDDQMVRIEIRQGGSKKIFQTCRKGADS